MGSVCVLNLAGSNLMMMDGLTLKTTFEKANGMEVAEQQASELQVTEAAVGFARTSELKASSTSLA